MIGGWAHSHPFPGHVTGTDTTSNLFLSFTDVQTQLSWQLSEDRAGNPYLALVIDPLVSLAKGRPYIGAFRCYPPEYKPPAGMDPLGVIWADEKARNEMWGESCISYYQLKVSYFTNDLSAHLLAVLGKDWLWTRALSSTASLDVEVR